ncbi:MAG: helix-turn-helix domain-containing protein [Candidatus Paceibacterota bacterium]
MKSTLKDLGLTSNEITVYEALVKLKGSSSAGDIIKFSNLHRNIVYDCLSHLENKGLVQEVEKNKKKFFNLKSPDSLITGFEKQIKSVGELSKIIQALPFASGHEVSIYEGSIAWQEAWSNVMQNLKPKSTFYTIGMAGDPWVKLMGETFVEYEQWALKNKVTDKIISQKHLQKEIEAHQNKQFCDIRYIDIDLSAHTSIEIFEDRVFFEIYDNPQTLIEIRSMALVITFKAYFELLWKTGK